MDYWFLLQLASSSYDASRNFGEHERSIKVAWITSGSYPNSLSTLQISQTHQIDEKVPLIRKNLFDSWITQPWKPLVSSSSNSFNQSSEDTNWTLLRLLQSLLLSGIPPGRKRWHRAAYCKAPLRKLAKIAWRGVFVCLLLLHKKLFGKSLQIARQSWLEGKMNKLLASEAVYWVVWITQFEGACLFCSQF